MSNIVQIKRSATTATPPTLAVGELAYSELSDNLYIGKSGNQVGKIGGVSDVVKLAGIEAGAQVNTVNSVSGKTGVVTLVSADVGLGNVDNTSDVNKPISTATQTALNLKAPLASPTFTGTITVPRGSITGSRITHSGLQATDNADATNSTGTSGAIMTYGGISIAKSLWVGGLFHGVGGATFGGVVTVPAPTNSTDAATKAYVDSVATGLVIKAAVKTATTAAGTLATSFVNGMPVGGTMVATGDRILIKDQVTASENGIYIVNASGAPTRAPDADNNPGNEVSTGMMTYVSSGTLAGTQWVLTTVGTITLGTTGLTFSQFGGGATYSAGSGLTLTGTTFAVDGTVLTTASTLDVTKLSTGTASAFNGSAITSLSAGNISSGTLNDARLSTNVLLITSTIDGGSF